MSQNIQLRQQNPEEEDKMAQFESPDGDAICASYVARSVAEQLGEYAQVTVSDDAEVTASLNKTTTNYGVYETPGGAVTGLYVSHDALTSIHGGESDAENAPESIGLSFAPSSEDEWEEADTVDEDEVDGLLADSDDSDEQEAEAEEEEEAEELVEIDDDELDLEA